MTEARQIATVQDYGELVLAFRARADELRITRDTIDAISGLSYSSKLLSWPPIRSMGNVSLGAILQTLGLRIHLVEDLEALERINSRMVETGRPDMLGGGKIGTVTIRISHEKLRRLGRLGGLKRAAVLTARQRKRIAKNAVRVREQKRRQQVVA
jgi:hypothetical protein